MADHHETRMQIGQGSMQILETLDDDVLGQIQTTVTEIDRAACMLRDRGLSARHIAAMMVGFCAMAAIEE